MALDKLVDSSQLDTDLTSVANAIRTKGGTSAQLAFPAGFVSAVQAIPTGTTPTGTKQISIAQNGTTTEDVTNYASAEITVNVPSAGDYVATDWVDLNKPVGAIVSGVSMNSQWGWQYALCGRTKITTVRLTNATAISASFLYNAKVTKLIAPKATKLYSACCRNCTSLTAVDVGANSLASQAFDTCSSLGLIVLRSSTVAALANVNALANTKFKSGGAGGTIYIPKSLYDQLGTGTNDYKAATNWRTYDGYGTITWAQIEGSIYETQYVDGTPIPTT